MYLFQDVVLSFFGTLFFALKSAHWYTIRWIIGIQDLSIAFLFLLSLVFLYRYLVRESSRIWLVLSYLSFLLCYLSKSTALMLPIMVTVFVMILYHKRRLSAPAVRLQIPYYLISLIFTPIYLFLLKIPLLQYSLRDIEFERTHNYVELLKWFFDSNIVRKLIGIVLSRQASPAAYFYSAFFLAILLYLAVRYYKNIYGWLVLGLVVPILFAAALPILVYPGDIYIPLFSASILIVEIIRTVVKAANLRSPIPKNIIIVVVVVVFLMVSGSRKLELQSSPVSSGAETLRRYIHGIQSKAAQTKMDKMLENIKRCRIDKEVLQKVIRNWSNDIYTMEILDERLRELLDAEGYRLNAKKIIDCAKQEYVQFPPGSIIYVINPIELTSESNFNKAIKLYYQNPKITGYVVTSSNVKPLNLLKHKGVEKGYFFEYLNEKIQKRDDIRELLHQPGALKTLMEIIESR